MKNILKMFIRLIKRVLHSIMFTQMIRINGPNEYEKIEKDFLIGPAIPPQFF